MTTEPPRGIKANLQRSYQNIITAETYQELKDAEKDADVHKDASGSRMNDGGVSEDAYMDESLNAGQD